MFRFSPAVSGKQVEAIILAVVIAVVSVADAAILYLARDAVVRLALGLFALASLLWAAGRLGAVYVVVAPLGTHPHKRRFVQMRALVQQFLDGIRLLNWMAVDIEKGVRSREAAMQEMDAIENHLTQLIGQIRSAAGHESARRGDTEAAED